MMRKGFQKEIEEQTQSKPVVESTQQAKSELKKSLIIDPIIEHEEEHHVDHTILEEDKRRKNLRSSLRKSQLVEANKPEPYNANPLEFGDKEEKQHAGEYKNEQNFTGQQESGQGPASHVSHHVNSIPPLNIPHHC